MFKFLPITLCQSIVIKETWKESVYELVEVRRIMYPNKLKLKYKTASCLVMTAQFPVLMTPPLVYLIPFNVKFELIYTLTESRNQSNIIFKIQF